MGWTTSKGSKRRRTPGRRFLSILTCCSFTESTGQDTSRTQSSAQDRATRRSSSHHVTASQTLTYSTASLASKPANKYSSITTTDNGDDETDTDTNNTGNMADQKNSTALVEEKQSEPIIPASPTGQERDAIGQHGQTMLQKDTFRHDDNNNNSDDGYGVDFQETTTPSLDSEQDLWLLGPIREEDKGRKCLVLDLDETLVHSSFKVTPQADFVVPVEIDGSFHNVFVLKRPGVDAFMKRMGELYEIVIFTASLSNYANPVLDTFDIHRTVQHRLFRESCFHYKGTYVKDLSQLGRELGQVIILDNSPASYIFHTANAVPVSSWFNDLHDSELVDLIPFLEDLSTVDNITDILDNTIPGPFSHF
ncbi:hypothetical protein [Absidia glauca]|uniref:FCP1 homology domain-containing protein n=1 Tax=Absidia glauca TaxID=4829 RepID=A0A163JJM1_ABSGL|nr:hypothetical protein [Absidia glauca]